MKKIIRKIFLVGLALTFVVSFSSANNGKVYTINLAYTSQTTDPTGQQAIKWKELVEERSNGRIQFKLFPSSQLGSEQDVVEQAASGHSTMALTAADFLMDYVADIGVLVGPYLTEDFDDLLYLTTTEWFDNIRDEMRKKNLEFVNTTTVYGARHLLTNKKVLTPEDLNGMKVRVPESRLAHRVLDAMGARATPYPLAELYTALQQGLVDGAENPLAILEGVKAHEISKYLALTGHQKFTLFWVIGADFYNSLPDDLVQILKETGDEAAVYGRQVMEERNETILDDFRAAGVEVNEIDLEPFKERTKKVYSEFSEWSPGLYDKIQALIKERHN